MTAYSVKIVDYDERWPQLFRTEREMLLALPSNPIVDIEHFGSTAVPGLPAKPIIDMMASVPTLEDGHGFTERIGTVGYRVVDVGFRHRVFLVRPASPTGFNLHLVPCTIWAHKNERLFRDWLISHPDVAHAYAALKRDLAERFAADARGYTKAKTEFISVETNKARRSLGLPDEVVWEE